MIVAAALAALALVGSVPPSSEPKPIPAGYTPLVDDTGSIVVAVPASWTEVDLAPAVNEDHSPRPTIGASPNLASFIDTFDTPGMLYAAFPFELNPFNLIEEYGLTGEGDARRSSSRSMRTPSSWASSRSARTAAPRG